MTASLSFSLAVVALAFGLAGLANETARVWMKTWEKQRYIDGAQQWHQAYSRLIIAHQLNPLSADYSANLGRLMEWRAWGQMPGSAQYIQDRKNAEYFYLQAIHARPGWGFIWANFAENRLLQGSTDAEFFRALEAAIFYAPWEAWTLRKVAWMGMATWNELPEHMRPMVEDSIRRSVDLEGFLNEIVRLAIQYDWLENLEPMLHTQRQRESLEFVRKQLKAQ